ncbi:MAG: phosphatase PAP2 family protein [Kofleriaceae bacterium]
MALLRRLFAALRQSDLRLVAELAIVGVLIMIFLKLGSEVGELDTDEFDNAVLLAMRHTPDDPIGDARVEAAVSHISALGSGVVTGLIVLILALYFALDGRWRYAMLLLATAIGTGIAMAVLKAAYGRPRPSVVTGIGTPESMSFPSGHSMISMALYLTLGMLLAQSQERRRLKIFAIATSAVLALAIGLSRIYLGVHYPTDVLAGWTAGASWALICGLVLRRVGRKTIEGDQAPEATGKA